MAKEKTEIVKPTSQLDLEARLKDDAVANGNITGTKTLNPSPEGDEGYIGVDPMYQNYANDQHKPLTAKTGADAAALKDFQAAYQLPEEADVEYVDDPGLGGKAPVAKQASLDQSRFEVPGQVVNVDDEAKRKAEEKEEEQRKADEAAAATPPAPAPPKP